MAILYPPIFLTGLMSARIAMTKPYKRGAEILRNLPRPNIGLKAKPFCYARRRNN
jgi:hypothetical protein